MLQCANGVWAVHKPTTDVTSVASTTLSQLMFPVRMKGVGENRFFRGQDSNDDTLSQRSVNELHSEMR